MWRYFMVLAVILGASLIVLITEVDPAFAVGITFGGVLVLGTQEVICLVESIFEDRKKGKKQK